MDDGGSGAAETAAEDQGLLGRFVDFVKERKTVPLEELAAEFGLRTTDAINRVQGLEQMGRLTGVMDDRGKYIYISPEEMEAVAAFIQERGRVSIQELADKSNEFIRLEAGAGGPPQSKKSGAMTRVMVASILMRTWRDGPAVSLKGSPTVSPVTEALWLSEFLPP